MIFRICPQCFKWSRCGFSFPRAFVLATSVSLWPSVCWCMFSQFATRSSTQVVKTADRDHRLGRYLTFFAFDPLMSWYFVYFHFLDCLKFLSDFNCIPTGMNRSKQRRLFTRTAPSVTDLTIWCWICSCKRIPIFPCYALRFLISRPFLKDVVWVVSKAKLIFHDLPFPKFPVHVRNELLLPAAQAKTFSSKPKLHLRNFLIDIRLLLTPSCRSRLTFRIFCFLFCRNFWLIFFFIPVNRCAFSNF